MKNFSYARPSSIHQAIELAATSDAMILAGGTELLNWTRIGIAEPSKLVDITRVAGLEGIEQLPNGVVRVGALTKLNDVALHPLIRKSYPVLSTSILKAASAQIRNLATIGGNPLQRVRCPYFRADEPTPCNKRTPRSGCAAFHGLNEKHAIFGWTEDCVAVQPSDPAAALAALDAVIVIQSKQGGRRIPATTFHTLPSEDPTAHSVLQHGELIAWIELGKAVPKSAYLKIRERESYEYATVSAAVALEMEGPVIRRARIALGSVAMRPWRLVETERRLAGLRSDSPEIIQAVKAGFADARSLSMNRYKIRLAQNTAVRAIEMAVQA
jgi:xanthine dehydrogenase YagS FAD-binding subunit